ncbi:Protein SPT2-like protein, partial [Harpegnathos saltator]
YQTKFAPLKKQTKQSKALSENIKRFLARKEEEEKQKALEEKRKKENLLALRDRKAQSRINKHLKVCKSANKSVLADAIDNDNTAITITGPSQPDEDDYGYVSQEAAALYTQLMNKYNKLPPEKPIFSNNEKRTVNDIASTKDRLKQAFKQQELGGTDGHRRKRKITSLNVRESETDEKLETKKVKEEEKNEKPKIKKKLQPPPIDFAELLKLAEKKQHEPVLVEVKPKVEELRPMTKRQQQEYMREKERKEQREKNSETNKKLSTISTPSKPIKTQSNKIPKTIQKPITSNTNIPDKSILRTALTVSKKINSKPNGKHSLEKTDSSKSPLKNDLLEERKKLEAERKQLEEMRRVIEEERKKLAQSQNKQEDSKSQVKSSNKVLSKSKVADKQVSCKDVKPRQFPLVDLKLHSSLINDKPKQFPSSDIRSMKNKQIVKKPSASNKRRMYDDDEEEYDSDMNDFIDDGPEEDNEDYSKYISEIFGYDKSKYRQIDDEDDAAIESNFAQQLKEEYVSTKIGIMEDLEDMRIEALEKKRKEEEKKALLKKKIGK